MTAGTARAATRRGGRIPRSADGVIDGSVLTAVGLLLMFDIVNKIPAFLQAVKDGKSIRSSKGDFSAEVNGRNE